MNTLIGLVQYGLDRPTSGITRYTQELISAFRQSRVPVTIFHAGRVATHNGLIPLWGAARAPGLLTLGQIEIARRARQHNVGLIHDPTGMMPLFLTATKRIATIHDVIPYIHPENSTLMDRMIYRYWIPVAVKRLDRIITVSQYSKADIVHHLHIQPEKISVVPQGVDRRYHPIHPSETQVILKRRGIDFPYILYVSAVQPRKKRKNLPRVLEAFAEVLRFSCAWRLVVVGSVRKDYRPVFDVLERLNLQQHVHFTGFVPEEELPAIYSGADLFILPSLYEGFGLPVLEAMACGVPVITSNASSLPEVASGAAILVDPYDIGAMASAMRQVLTDMELAADLRSKGLKRAGQYSWDRTAQQTIAVYESVLGEKILSKDC